MGGLCGGSTEEGGASGEPKKGVTSANEKVSEAPATKAAGDGGNGGAYVAPPKYTKTGAFVEDMEA